MRGDPQRLSKRRFISAWEFCRAMARGCRATTHETDVGSHKQSRQYLSHMASGKSFSARVPYRQCPLGRASGSFPTYIRAQSITESTGMEEDENSWPNAGTQTGETKSGHPLSANNMARDPYPKILTLDPKPGQSLPTLRTHRVYALMRVYGSGSREVLRCIREPKLPRQTRIFSLPPTQQQCPLYSSMLVPCSRSSNLAHPRAGPTSIYTHA